MWRRRFTNEALALGMPYITRDSKSNRELLNSGVNCVSVPSGDASAIKDAILGLQDNQGLRDRLGASAYVTFIENASVDVLGEKLLTVLKI